jgi:hypothetical protein
VLLWRFMIIQTASQTPGLPQPQQQSWPQRHAATQPTPHQQHQQQVALPMVPPGMQGLTGLRTAALLCAYVYVAAVAAGSGWVHLCKDLVPPACSLGAVWSSGSCSSAATLLPLWSVLL